jgi:hypothetical protein
MGEGVRGAGMIPLRDHRTLILGLLLAMVDTPAVGAVAKAVMG